VAWKAAAFSLLLVAGLSLVLIRRTMVPLETLMGGTRRLAQRDWSARVDVPGGDEFGQLAGSFNEMAGRIERQMLALQVQSEIDREILGGPDLARVLGQVMARLQVIAPAAQVGLLIWRPRAMAAGRAWPRARRRRPPWRIDPDLLRRAETEASLLQGTEARLALRLLGLPDGDVQAGVRGPWPVHVVPVRANGRPRALLMLAGVVPDADELHRELHDLADRLAVMLVASDRERALHQRAVLDSLTGLLNRAGLIETVDRRLAAVDEAGFVLAYIDLDGFKSVNDSPRPPGGRRAAVRGGTSAAALACRPMTPSWRARAATNSCCCCRPDREAADALAACHVPPAGRAFRDRRPDAAHRCQHRPGGAAPTTGTTGWS
jgi:HAMP domain-containing protein